ncbi:MAG: hypothetical protein HZA92_20055 [Verrucomicrobia bacterium]|nr:hypothetical protein [Verrucomicrobiota bacterium]
MEFIFELVFNIVGELFLQLVGELLVDYGLRSTVDGDTARRHPLLSFFGNVLLGAIAGGLSLLVFNVHLLKAPWLRVAMLFVIPPLAGLAMSAFGKWQEKHGGERASLERFWHGLAFALAMGLVRFFFAK